MFNRIKINSNNIGQDSFDETLFNELAEASGNLQDVLSTPPIANEPWRAIVKDFWAGFYKFNPKMIPEGEVDSLYRANRPFIEKFLEDPATEQTRIYTRLDELSAGMATIGAVKELNEQLNNRPDLKEKFDQFYKDQQQNGPNDESINQIIADLQALSRDVRRAVKESIEAGQKQAEDLNENLKSWGLEPGDLKSVPLEKRLELANFLSNNDRIKDLSKIIGRLRNLARSRQKEKVKARKDDIHSITLGNDLSYTLPVELAAMNDDVLELDFFRKYTESSLLQYELKDNTPKGQGPIIAAIDISGSMEENSKLDLAIATALSLIDTASRQKRKAYTIFFNGEIKKELEFLPREKNIEKYLEIAQIGASGGTNFMPPLKRSLEIIQDTNYKKADLVFISDGESRISEDFLKEFLDQKFKFDFKCYTVLIGFDSEEIKKWSDKVWAVSNIDESIAGEIFEIVY
jgi:uncharacterized protein with von Willebrand factor type A (vWA) domain